MKPEPKQSADVRFESSVPASQVDARSKLSTDFGMKIDGFLIGMLTVVGLALAWPQFGAAGGPLPLATFTSVGISLLFFLHGANLSREALASGAANWRLHLFVQSGTFILFPILGTILMAGTRTFLPWEARLGLFFLCALPSTVSSSIAMVALARGHVSGAVFNASLSGLIGMVLTPLLMTPGIGTHLTGQRSSLQSILEIALMLLLPLAASHLFRPMLALFLAKRKNWIGKLDRSVILLIVYASFCQSTADGLWSRYEPVTLAKIAAVVAGLLVTALTLTRLLARSFGFDREDEITAVFCGSKKSVANGAPIAQTLFGSNPAMGMILLPLLIYHQLQLLICTVLAQRYAAASGKANPQSLPRSEGLLKQ